MIRKLNLPCCRICLEKSSLVLDSPARNFATVVNKVVDSCGLNERMKAILRKNLLWRDQNVRKKSLNFGAVVEDLMSEKAKMEKLKEQNEKLLRMAGKERKLSGNDKLAWISGKGPTDQVTVRDSTGKSVAYHKI